MFKIRKVNFFSGEGDLNMPICQNCQKQWAWKETIKASFTFNTWLLCPHCTSKQYVAKNARLTSAIALFMPILLMFITLFFQLSVRLILLIVIGATFLVILIYPFTIKLSNEEELFY